MSTRRKVRIINIRHGRAPRERILYAQLVDAISSELLLSATLHFVLSRVEDMDYEVVEHRDPIETP